MIKLNKILPIIAVTTLLISCADQSRYVNIDEDYVRRHSKSQQINYKPSISIETKDLRLKKIIEETTDKDFKVTDEKLATLKLYIDSTIIADKLAKQQANLVGILKKKESKYNYKVTYKLVDSIENVILHGDVTGLSDSTTKTIANSPTVANKSSLDDAAQQIITKINSQLHNVLIDFKVVSVSSDSVFIAVNKGIKLSTDDVFLANQLSGTALGLDKIIPYETYDLAELKVITGQFPKVGMTINLQK